LISKDEFDSLISQPLEGFLYDLDLLPEQIDTNHLQVVAEVVTEMYKRLNVPVADSASKLADEICAGTIDFPGYEGREGYVSKCATDIERYTAKQVLKVREAELLEHTKAITIIRRLSNYIVKSDSDMNEADLIAICGDSTFDSPYDDVVGVFEEAGNGR